LPLAGFTDPTALSISALGHPLKEALSRSSKPRLTVYYEALVRAWRTGEEKPFLYDTVSDSFHVMDYMVSRQEIDPARIGVTGISLGGMEAWLMAAADERVAAVAPAIGVQSFRYALENELWHDRVGTIKAVFEAAAKDMGKAGIDKDVVTAANPKAAKDLCKAGVDRDVVEAVWRRIVPGLVDGDFDAALTLPCYSSLSSCCAGSSLFQFLQPSLS